MTSRIFNPYVQNIGTVFYHELVNVEVYRFHCGRTKRWNRQADRLLFGQLASDAD